MTNDPWFYEEQILAGAQPPDCHRQSERHVSLAYAQCYALPLEMPLSQKLPIQIRMLPRSPAHTACRAEGDIHCPGVHLDSLQTMAKSGPRN